MKKLEKSVAFKKMMTLFAVHIALSGFIQNVLGKTFQLWDIQAMTGSRCPQKIKT